MILFVVATGFGMAAQWLFRRTVNDVRLRTALNRIAAQFMEIRLYFDEPRIVWSAHLRMMRWNLILLGTLFRPLAIPSLLGVALLWLLYPKYGTLPLPEGQPVVLTAQLRTPVPVKLTGSERLAIETRPIYSSYDRQVSWRVRPLRSDWKEITLRAGGTSLCIASDQGRVHYATGDVAWVELPRPANPAWPWNFVALAAVGALATSFLL